MSDLHGFKFRWNGEDTYHIAGVEMGRGAYLFTLAVFGVNAVALAVAAIVGIVSVLT